MTTNPALTEKAFLGQVTAHARLMGWRTYHPWMSVRSVPGWPDLFAVRRGRAVAVELKTARGRVTEAQREWIAALNAVPGITALVATPADWDKLEELLS